MSRILRGGPRTFDNQLLMLTRWRKGMNASNVTLYHASHWVQILGAPFGMVSPQVATKVGNRLGNVEEVERRRSQDTPNLFMRVHVTLPISKPLRHEGFIANSKGEHTWVKFKYESLPLFCHFCGLLRHDLLHCASHFAVQKNGGIVKYQYGDWLKATCGCQRSPPWDGSSSNNQAAGMWMSMIPKVHFMDNPQHEDNSEKHGIGTKTQLISTEKKGMEDVDNRNSIPITVDTYFCNPHLTSLGG